MKRLIAAFALAFLIGILCFGAEKISQKKCRDIQATLEECRNYYMSDEAISAAKKARILEKEWKNTKKYLTVFSNHSYIDTISESITRLPYFIVLNNDENFYGEYARISLLLNSIHQDQQLHIESFY